jgi:hypothetical protein
MIVLLVLNLLLNTVQTLRVTEQQKIEIQRSSNFIIIEDGVNY